MVKSNYDRFWELVLVAFAGQGEDAIEAIARLRRIDYGPDGSGGQTGYVNGVDPVKAATDYYVFIHDGAPKNGRPDWLRFAEDGK